MNTISDEELKKKYDEVYNNFIKGNFLDVIKECNKILKKRKHQLFFNFDNYWIQKSDVVPINYKENIFKRVKIFKNVKYKWGGKRFDGIDCSGLVQLFYKFNNLYCPRDTGPQFRYFKKLKSIKKNTIIFWKGHVAICLSKKKLIHAYGPRKKVIIMDIKKTISLIERTAKLDVIGIK